MNPCGIRLGMDVNACIASWVPDWLAPLMPYLPLAAVILALGVAYRVAGLPGITAAAAAIGYILGRRSVKDEAHENVSGPDAAPPVKKKHKTLLDRLFGG